MNAITLLPETKQEGENLESEISTIIDARIQFLESNSTHLFHSTALKAQKQGVNLEKDYDSFMRKVTKLNHNIRYLHILRSWMTKRNVRLVLQLLTTNTYLDLSEQELTKKLNAITA